jgi:hypothetical protein
MARRRVSPPIVRWLGGLLASAMLVAAVSGLVAFLGSRVPAFSGVPADNTGPPRYLLVLYVLVVMPVAIRWGTALAAVTAVLSAAVYAYLFLPPLHSLRVADPRNVVALGVFLVTALAVGQLAARMRRAARQSARLSEEQSALRRVACWSPAECHRPRCSRPSRTRSDTSSGPTPGASPASIPTVR